MAINWKYVGAGAAAAAVLAGMSTQRKIRAERATVQRSAPGEHDMGYTENLIAGTVGGAFNAANRDGVLDFVMDPVQLAQYQAGFQWW